MSLEATYGRLHRELAALLRQARRKVFAGALRARMPSAVYRAAQTVTALAGVWLIVRLALAVRGDAPPGWGRFALAAAVAGSVAAGIVLLRALRRAPGLREAAQRLDLAVRDHNRIAIALAILEAGDTTPFARAAVEDGLAHARRLKDADPRVEAGRWKRRQIGYLLGLTVLLVLTSAWIGPRPGSVVTAQDSPAALPSMGQREPAVAVKDNAGPLERRTEPHRPLAVASAKREARVSATRQEARESTRGERASGKAGGGTSAESAQAGRPLDALSDAGESTTPSKFSERKEARPARPRQRKETPRGDSRPTPSQEENSSIQPGSAGGGALSAAQTETSQKIQNAEGDRDDEDTDQESEDAAEANTQRGGIQPMLKDRQAAPTRDLGITGEGDQPGTGRGGPSPPKKARGTASLVLGVPIPDFVRGRLGPGMTKITHERMEPPALPGEPPAGAPAG
ncbi:MAG: hypothetical protein HRF43_11245, partial [Phycisphaerae bacterium]